MDSLPRVKLNQEDLTPDSHLGSPDVCAEETTSVISVEKKKKNSNEAVLNRGMRVIL